MAKVKEIKEGKCPNCNDTGVFDDDGVEKTCPCQGLKD